LAIVIAYEQPLIGETGLLYNATAEGAKDLLISPAARMRTESNAAEDFIGPKLASSLEQYVSQGLRLSTRLWQPPGRDTRPVGGDLVQFVKQFVAESATGNGKLLRSPGASAQATNHGPLVTS
jgi:hypothetical protein